MVFDLDASALNIAKRIHDQYSQTQIQITLLYCTKLQWAGFPRAWNIYSITILLNSLFFERTNETCKRHFKYKYESIYIYTYLNCISSTYTTAIMFSLQSKTYAKTRNKHAVAYVRQNYFHVFNEMSEKRRKKKQTNGIEYGHFWAKMYNTGTCEVKRTFGDLHFVK